MINELYEGIMVDYVKCLQCGIESKREDKFLDLSLTVRSDFDNIYNKSVEMALENYIRPDRLEGENKYACDNC
jgi:ubiquitin carboxyl-terminal hydrolase 47